jgi:tetratricopeptide (TPR) repeat protein
MKRGADRTAVKPPPLPADQFAARLHEANVHRVEGRYDEAQRRYAELERSNPKEFYPSYFMALIDLAEGRPAPAHERLAPLARRQPDEPLVWFAYAKTLRELGRWPESVKASRRALLLIPTDTFELLELADALQVVGEMDESLSILRGLAADPSTRLIALVRMARVDPASIGRAERAELATAAAAEETDASLRSSLNVTLGALLERQGDFDGAFAAFAEAARLKRQMLVGEIEGPERPLFSQEVRALHPDEAGRIRQSEIDYVRTLFTPTFIAEHQGQGSHLAAPIFIVGMPRSGSTLVEQILSSHAKVQGLGESGVLIQTLADKYPIKLFAPHGPDHFRQLAQDYLARMHDQGWTNSPRFVDKMLDNYVFVGAIHLMFPNATILHTVRDPVDTCLSNFRTLFLSGQEESYDLADIGRAYVRYRRMMEHWNEVLPGRVIDVDHEVLVADPAGRIRWLVTEACGLGWDPACLEFYKTKRSVRTASIAQVRQPIFNASVKRWRRYEKHLGPLFDALGPYAPQRP